MRDCPDRIEEVTAGLEASYSDSEPLAEDLIAIRNEYNELSDGEQQKHVYACAGLALYCAQCFEAELTQVILGIKQAKGELLSPEEYDALDLELSKKTLGLLICEVRRLVELNEQGIAIIKKALDARNSLVHGFFWSHAEDMVTDKGRRKVLDNLLKRIQLFRAADSMGDVIVRGMLHAMGVPNDHIEKVYEEILDRLRAEEE